MGKLPSFVPMAKPTAQSIMDQANEQNKLNHMEGFKSGKNRKQKNKTEYVLDIPPGALNNNVKNSILANATELLNIQEQAKYDGISSNK